VAAYALYWFDGFFAGPRFMFTIVPPLVLFAARAPGLVARHVSGVTRRAVFLVVPLCVLWSWLIPSGVSGVQREAYVYHAARTKLKTDVSTEVHSAGLHHALVFIHESWRARLDARLRAFRLTPGESDRILGSSDACQVQEALDTQPDRPSEDTTGRWTRLWSVTRPTAPLRPVPGLSADQSILLSQGRPLTASCRREIAADSIGVAPFAPFLELEGLDPDGSLGGNLVFARDFGAHNEVLRARFPGRTWYRYRPPRSATDTTWDFLPYQ
jgi:hypothetical protein